MNFSGLRSERPRIEMSNFYENLMLIEDNTKVYFSISERGLLIYSLLLPRTSKLELNEKGNMIIEPGCDMV
jgi:hypothetical protein